MTDKYGCAMCLDCYQNGIEWTYYCKHDLKNRNLRDGGPMCNFDPSRFRESPEGTPFKIKPKELWKK